MFLSLLSNARCIKFINNEKHAQCSKTLTVDPHIYQRGGDPESIVGTKQEV
jgi:hypothetical protein